MAVGVGGVAHALQQAGVDEHPQPRRERRPRDPQVAHELPVAAHAEERLAQDQQRPLFAEQGKGAAGRLRLEAMGQVVLQLLHPHTASTSLPVFSPLNSLSRTSGNCWMSPWTTSSRERSSPVCSHLPSSATASRYRGA